MINDVKSEITFNDKNIRDFDENNMSIPDSWEQWKETKSCKEGKQ